ncbi:MAG: N-acetyltransferase [Proteobacteria bacterium]|nr:N-acetyltransferase [Pseudomonadota bacterium]NBP14558.1 N-acetyltransferase [bacterium]
MIKKISWKKIYQIWQNHLWPGRLSAIEPTSAMLYIEGHDVRNMESVPTFFGYYLNNKLIGVNSGHICVDGSYRSRGLWVDPIYRGQGYGKELLLETIEQGKYEQSNHIWSYPRKTSWTTYQSVGFNLGSKWQASETSESNAFCFLDLKS